MSNTYIWKYLKYNKRNRPIMFFLNGIELIEPSFLFLLFDVVVISV